MPVQITPQDIPATRDHGDFVWTAVDNDELQIRAPGQRFNTKLCILAQNNDVSNHIIQVSDQWDNQGTRKLMGPLYNLGNLSITLNDGVSYPSCLAFSIFSGHWRSDEAGIDINVPVNGGNVSFACFIGPFAGDLMWQDRLWGSVFRVLNPWTQPSP